MTLKVNNSVFQIKLFIIQVVCNQSTLAFKDDSTPKRLQMTEEKISNHEIPCEAGYHWNWLDRKSTRGICTRHYTDRCKNYDTSVGKCIECEKNYQQVKWGRTHSCALYGLNQFDREWLAFASLFIFSLAFSVTYGIIYTVVKIKQDRIDLQREIENRQVNKKQDSKSNTGNTENSVEKRIIGVPSKADIHNYLRKAFDIYDSEKLGCITKDDLSKLTYHSCINQKLETITDSQLERIINIVNDNDNGKFTFRQLVKVVGPILEQQFKRAYIVNLEKMKRDLNNQTTQNSTEGDIKMKLLS